MIVFWDVPGEKFSHEKELFIGIHKKVSTSSGVRLQKDMSCDKTTFTFSFLFQKSVVLGGVLRLLLYCTVFDCCVVTIVILEKQIGWEYFM